MIEHVVLAGIVGEDNIAARTYPSISIRGNGYIAARCEVREGHAILVDEGSERRQCATHAHTVTTEGPIAVIVDRRKEVVVAVMLKKLLPSK